MTTTDIYCAGSARRIHRKTNDVRAADQILEQIDRKSSRDRRQRSQVGTQHRDLVDR